MPEPVALHQLTATGRSDAPALTYKDRTLTYAELADQVDRVSAGLRALGLGRGDRVLVWAEKRIETVVALLAVSAAGGVLVPVNPLFRARHLGHVAGDCTARAVITTAERVETLREALDGHPSVEHVVLMGWSDVELDGRTVTAWDDVAAHDPAPAQTVIDADVAAIFYTSGSTGGPKGVVLSQRNLLAGAQSVAGYLGHTAQDTVLAVLPLSFDAGFSQVSTALIAGAHVVLTNYLTPREVVRLCQRHHVTGLTCVPPLWLQLAALTWPPAAVEHLRYFANTGGRMPQATLRTLRTLFPAARPYLMYGLTEAFRSTYLDPEQAAHRPDSIGKAIPNAQILVLRPDGTECAPGEHGELVHRGALVSLGYWNDPDRTAERFRPLVSLPGLTRPELAVFSGDTAYRDEEGYLYFVGRTDDMIKTSGFRVSPTEIEEAAYATGLVREVAAFGLPDPELGHRIVLAVAPACDDELLRKAMAREVPSYMLAHRTVMFDQLPRSMNGKFDRVVLRDQLAST